MVKPKKTATKAIREPEKCRTGKTLNLACLKGEAQKFRARTGRALGITGEIAEHEAARLLDLERMPPQQEGFDAKDRDGRRIQIKGRCLREGAAPGRLGAIKKSKSFDAVLMVLLDESFEVVAMHEASGHAVREALAAPGSKARNERGQLSVSEFKKIGRKVWPRSG